MIEGKLYISTDGDELIVKSTTNKYHNEQTFCGFVYDKGRHNTYIDGYTSCNWAVSLFREYKEPISDQVGGNHYKDLKIQPTEFIHANNIPFIEGNIIKYVIRHRSKNGIEDLKKAKHYIDLLINFEYESKENI